MHVRAVPEAKRAGTDLRQHGLEIGRVSSSLRMRPMVGWCCGIEPPSIHTSSIRLRAVLGNGAMVVEAEGEAEEEVAVVAAVDEAAVEEAIQME